MRQHCWGCVHMYTTLSAAVTGAGSPAQCSALLARPPG